MTQIEDAANLAGTKRHLSSNLNASALAPGRSGTALCSTRTNLVNVGDQAWLDGQRAARGLSTKSLWHLSACQNCARRKAKAESAQTTPAGLKVTDVQLPED